MFRSRDFLGKFALGCSVAAILFAPVESAQGESVLHAFAGPPSDGSNPDAGLIKDSAGNLYGTTFNGGSNDLGTVFEVTPDGREKVLYSFAGGSDGSNPGAGVIEDHSGNLYGATTSGGVSGAGTVFKLTRHGVETVLYSFTGGTDGSSPSGSLLMERGGNLYGPTFLGGEFGGGAVFGLAQDGTETVLHSFGSGGDGSGPDNGLIRDLAGNFYGETLSNGGGGYGAIYKVAPDGTETVLHTFDNNDGARPESVLMMDSSGNLYGTASNGGVNNFGTVFMLAPNGTVTVLYNFTGGSDGGVPQSSLIKDSAGNFYSTTLLGGANNSGTVFKLAPDGTETVLHSFGSGSDGSNPVSGLISYRGQLYGTTFRGGGTGCGGPGCGTVFDLGM